MNAPVSRLGAALSAALAVMLWAAPGMAITIDFDTDAGGVPLPAGTIVSNQWSALGVDISVISSTNTGIIFDTANPTGGDVDLGTPGPGLGNDVALGNVLIIAENVIDADADGLVDDPDDDGRGGTIRFDFASPITVLDLVFLDIDAGEPGGAVNAMANALLVSIPIPALGNNSVQTLPINLTHVSHLDVDFVSSGAVAAIRFVPEPASALFLGGGLVGLVAARRRARQGRPGEAQQLRG